MSRTSPSSKKTHAKKTTSPSTSRETELLLEIGTEELPYQFIAPTLRSLHEGMTTMLQSQRLSFGQIRPVGTPRRLVLMVERLATQQQSAVKEALGPSKAVAFDQAGQPTKAAIGFAASQGVPVEELQVRQTAKGDYVCAVKQEIGQAATAVLTQHLPGLIGRLSFPKAMQWNDTGVRFARPVRWLVALCGGKTLPIEFAGVTAGQISHGHRFMKTNTRVSAKGFPVRSVQQYVKETERQGVIVDQERRRAMVVEQLSDLAKSAQGQLHQDEDLLEQAIYTVEYPHTIIGSFKSDYLALPKEVLMTSMKEHQGFFALIDRSGALLPNFLAVTNMKLPDMQLIREGNERVLAARLADARFFCEEDRKITLADRLEKLQAVTFHQKIGTQFQRTMRIKELAGYLSEHMGNHELAQVTQRAAELSKTDLLTGIVGEFPTLQGIMGGEYAKHDGERPDVVEAIAEHYLPRGMEGEIPRTLAGKVLSLADRLDKIASFFWVGVIPKGSEDPYALRRDALSIVRIIIEGQLSLDLPQAIEKAEEGLKKSGVAGVAAGMQQDPIDFIIERLRFYAGTSGSIRRDDVIGAILTPQNRTRSLGNLLDLMSALQAVTTKPEFDPLIVGFKRAHRLVEKERWEAKPVEPSLFQHQAETNLQEQLRVGRDRFSTLMKQHEYARALEVLVQLKEPIDEFFNGVMVNADDPAIRANRLSLLKDVDELFMSFADFSQIVVQGL